ncbi:MULTISPECIES: hypothetical protein [Burkholderia]|uniref:hypothetical protein n=1 Tax=Burkholderia TaxID=32008 RepID=UPI001589DAB2|nr:hypothetical protein [Burkholderia cepacia]MCA8054335.1 hypothetical protein [Burkholderia cepacia]MCA8131360.1 hypothetical protein [Burkholderia cepacia]MCA8159123.1 hypothetical protein [Burkholderia cepacia]HEM7889478.1 hypothetical protein [Burkholderia cepacia]HEM8509915.1 hypothetical protein [Burkholderia cepacia]
MSTQFSGPIEKLESHFMSVADIRAAQLRIVFHTPEFLFPAIQFFFKEITSIILWPSQMDGKANQQKRKSG